MLYNLTYLQHKRRFILITRYNILPQYKREIQDVNLVLRRQKILHLASKHGQTLSLLVVGPDCMEEFIFLMQLRR